MIGSVCPLRRSATRPFGGPRRPLSPYHYSPHLAVQRLGSISGFSRSHLSTRAIEPLVRRYTHALKLDPGVTDHSLRVTALTTARERGADIIDLQDFAGHADPRTTLTYIRTRDRLSKSPAYVLNY